MTNAAVDLYLVYQFISRLVKPFNQWPAYKLGIIDEQGNVLIPRSKLSTGEQRDSFRLFDQLVLNVKKVLARIPGGNSKVATYAAALYLVKEHDNPWNEQDFLGFLAEAEVPVNVMGSSAAPSVSPPGNIAIVDKILNKRSKNKKNGTSNGKPIRRTDN